MSAETRRYRRRRQVVLSHCASDRNQHSRENSERVWWAAVRFLAALGLLARVRVQSYWCSKHHPPSTGLTS